MAHYFTNYLRFKGFFAGECGLAGSTLVFFLHLFWERTFLRALCPSCHPTNIVKALKETQSTDPTSGFAFCIALSLTSDGRGVAPFTPAVWLNFHRWCYLKFKNRYFIIKKLHLATKLRFNNWGCSSFMLMWVAVLLCICASIAFIVRH